MTHPDSNLDDEYYDWPEELSLAEQLQQETEWAEYAQEFLAPKGLKKENENGIQTNSDSLL